MESLEIIIGLFVVLGVLGAIVIILVTKEK